MVSENEKGLIPDSEKEIKEVMNEDITNAPTSPKELIERIEENTAASPADSGGDIDANWEDVNTSGSESVFGDNPTPDQSDAEANANAMGVNFDDDEPLDFTGKLNELDKNRYELDEDSTKNDPAEGI